MSESAAKPAFIRSALPSQAGYVLHIQADIVNSCTVNYVDLIYVDRSYMTAGFVESGPLAGWPIWAIISRYCAVPVVAPRKVLVSPDTAG